MKLRYYKIKNKNTEEFWTGYSSQFSKRGAEFRSLEDVGVSINTQIKFRHQSIETWIGNSEVIEYEVEVHDTGSYATANAIKLANLYDKLRKEYGDEFLKGFKKLIADPHQTEEFQYATHVDSKEYFEFRQTLKSLGYSSRQFRKIGDWIWFNSPDLGTRVKLISGYISFVDFKEPRDEFREIMGKDAPNK